MAKELAMDAASYEREYNGFLSKLKKFHEAKGTPFRRLPWLGGQFLDLYLLYKKVTFNGGWVKVTEDKKWRDIAEVFNLPATCTNAAFALRQHYSRYLEAYERIHFFGEDAEDVLVTGRPNTPVGMTPFIAPSEYTSSVVQRDENRNFEKLVLSLQCGLPNEVDFAINICMLLSNVSNSVFNLTKAPAVIDMLLAHVGVFRDESQSLKDVYKEWYQKTDRDFIKFWIDTLEVDEFRELFCGTKGVDDPIDDRIFNSGEKYGISSVEAQRVAQVCMILYNFSFDATNAEILASHGVCLKFLMMGICSRFGYLQSLAWDTLANLAEKMKLEPVEAQNTQIFFQVMHHFLNDKDRFRVIKAMDILGKLCTREDNDSVMEAALEMQGYESLIRILIIPDVQLVIGSLEALYNISGVGQITSDQIANVHHSVDTLVCMVTLDVDFFGPQALSEVQVLDTRIASSVPLTPRARPALSPVAVPASPTTALPPPSPAPSRNEIDAETFTFRWLKSTYENHPTGTVSRIDLYADYLSSCSRLARIGILNATSFNQIVKVAFPDAQLRRFPSGNQLQYALVGVRRRATPQFMPSQASHTSHSRTPTPPTPGQNSPSWNQRQAPQGMSLVRPSSPTGQLPGSPVQMGPAPGRRPYPAGPQTPGQSPQFQPSNQGANPNLGPQKHGMMGNALALQMRTRNQQMLMQQQRRVPQGMQGNQGMNVQQQQPTMAAPMPQPMQQRISPTLPMQNPLANPQQVQRQTPTPPMPPRSPRGVPSPGMMPQNSTPQVLHQNSLQQPSNFQQVMRQPIAQAAINQPPAFPNSPRIAPMPVGFPPARPSQVTISSAPPPPMQSPAPSTSLPGPGHNERPHPGTVPVGPQRPYQRLQRPVNQDMSQTHRFIQGGTTAPPTSAPQNQYPGYQPRLQRPEGTPSRPPPPSPQNWQRAQSPRVRPGPVPYPSPQEAAAGLGGRNYMQPIAPKPVTTQSASISAATLQSKPGSKPPADGVVLIAREERAEDVVSVEFLQNAEEQRIVVVENTNRGRDPKDNVHSSDPSSTNGTQNGHPNSTPVLHATSALDNDISDRTDACSPGTGEAMQGTGHGRLKRDSKGLESPSLNADSSRANTEHNGHEAPKKARLDDRAGNENSIGSPSLPCTPDAPSSLVNGNIRTEAKNKLMDKLLGKDLHMPLNGVCDMNPADLELIATDGGRLSGSHSSKSSSPDIFDSENNSDFGKYFEEDDTDTGLFSDVLSGDLRIDPVQSDKGKANEEQQKVPILPDLGYHVVAQELRDQALSASTYSTPFNKGLASNVPVKAPIPSTSSIRTPTQVVPPQVPQPGPNEMVLSRYGNQQMGPRYPIRAQVPNHEGTWNGPVKGNFQGGVTSTQQERPIMAQSPSQILEHRTRALVTPRASVMEQREARNRQHPTIPHTQPQLKNAPPVPAPVPYPMGPSPQPGTPPPATPPPGGEGMGQLFRPAVGSPTVESFKPYRCRWESCTSSFDASKQLFNHVVSAHVPRNTLIMSCSWEGCPPVRRSRSSLLFHLQQKHMEPMPNSPHPQQPQAAQQPPTPTQAHNPTPFPAYHLLARMLHTIQDEDESPLTKTIRLTAALVLRNIAQYSATARSLLRRHERHLSEVAMSSSEAALPVAACLSELSPHRKASQNETTNFIWALDG